jgi:hypothetical protein
MTVMTKRDTSLVVAEVDRLRADLGASASFREPGFLAALADRLMASPVLSSEPIVAAFVEDIRGFEAEPRLARTKKMINSGEGTIFSLFDASYFPSLSLDWLSYRELPADTHLAARYPSPTRPVVIERMSAGFASRVVVALFPENHIDGVQEPTDSIFYFIDKFVERHVRLTRRLVDAVMAEGTFALVRAASVTDVQTASSWWVRLHEYHPSTCRSRASSRWRAWRNCAPMCPPCWRASTTPACRPGKRS